MTKFELQSLLQDAAKLDFLSSIELIQSKEKDYKKSEYFKNTGIPLTTLYKEFYMWQKSQINFFDLFQEFITEFDFEKVSNRILDLLNYLNEKPELIEKANKILENFDIKNIEEYAKRLEKGVSILKKEVI